MGRAPATAPDGEDDVYTRHVATPTGLDFSRAAGLYGLGHVLIEDLGQLRAALGGELSAPGSAIVEVRTAREANVALHREVWRAVSAALSRSAGEAAPGA
jgi:2-succinyl-5-enolpyruvyl-6-hydroxy-3-cyclohexene-1-carboxylate synthase